MNHIETITAAAAEKGIVLSAEQMNYAIKTLESDISAHSKRVASWVAAGIEYDADAAICNVPAKARAAVRSARMI